MASNNMSPLRNFLNSIKSSVYNISIDGIGNTDINAGSLFNGFSNLYRVGPLNYTNYINNMSSLFGSCDNLTNISNFDTSNVTNMSDMFWGIGFSGTSVNIPNFNTSKVVDMSGMFSYFNFRNITLPNFNTSNVTNMHSMFFQADTYDKVPNFDTRKVTDMGAMFEMDYTISKIPNFNTSNVISMDYMFMACSNLTSIPNLNMIKVNDTAMMFDYCQNLITVPILNISNVINAYSMFGDCPNLSQASVNNIVTFCSTAIKVTNKNWTNIGFNVAADHRYNTWIRTAPDYMNAVNIGWQNIGEAILPAYKRRIMVGDELLTNIYFDFPDDYYTILENRPNSFEVFINTNIYRSKTFGTIYSNVTPYGDFVSHYIGSDMVVYAKRPTGEIYKEDMSNPSNYVPPSISTVIVTEIDDTNPSYRHCYIEDENIRPIQEGDVFGPGTKLYFVIPDDAYIKNSEELFLGGGRDLPFAFDPSNMTGFQISSGAGYMSGITIMTGTPPSNFIYLNSEQDGLNYNESYFEWPSNGKLYTFKPNYNETLFDAWVNSKYILVDKRTLYRNVKVGDNLKDRTFYFTFPDDMYTDPEMTETSSVIACSNPYFAFSSSNFDAGSQHIAYVQVTWNGNTVSWSTNNQSWSTTPGMQPYQGGDYGPSNWDILYTQCDSDLIVTTIAENNAVYKNIYIREEEEI